MTFTCKLCHVGSSPSLDLVKMNWIWILQFSIKIIWVRSQRCGCLVTWFCYQMIAKPGNKTATPSWPDPYMIKRQNLPLAWMAVLLAPSSWAVANVKPCSNEQLLQSAFMTVTITVRCLNCSIKIHLTALLDEYKMCECIFNTPYFYSPKWQIVLLLTFVAMNCYHKGQWRRALIGTW